MDELAEAAAVAVRNVKVVKRKRSWVTGLLCVIGNFTAVETPELCLKTEK